MRFIRTDLAPYGVRAEAYSAKAGPWNFLILNDSGAWTASYRLRDPKGSVSASSTIMGPFDEFSDATRAAEEKLAELRRLA